MPARPDVTSGTLLGGKVQYRQTVGGHRSGIEPVLLAASVPARAGDAVLEAGTGAGAGLLCLSHRVARITGVGIERDEVLAQLAATNFAINGMDNLAAVAADVNALPLTRRFDHCLANPPWFAPANTASPDPGRDRAHRASPGLLRNWACALGAVLKSGGSLTFIVPASLLDECIVAMREADCGFGHLMPFWPRVGRPSKILIVQSWKSRRGPCVLMPGLVLHGTSGYTAQADAILRQGEGLKANG